MNFNANHTQPMLDNYLQSALNNAWRYGSKAGVEYNLSANIPPPPPEYELNSGGSTSTTPDSKSNEKLSSLSSLSRSHQDLSKLDEELNSVFKSNLHLNTYRYPLSYHSLINDGSPSSQQNITDILRNENTSLRNELDSCSRKISKLQKLEMELQKVHQAHEDLIKSSEKKEKLERAIRYKLEIEIKSLRDENKNLKEHLNAALNTLANSKKNPEAYINDNEFKNEIHKRDVLIAQLLTQNKELTSEKERQEIELQAQRLTLEEQRNHIEVLDNALMNAQNNVVKLDAELRKKAAYEERANHLQKALDNLRLASERRSQMEKRVRNHLEKEIESLKKQLSGSAQISDEKKEMEALKKALVDYEEKIITLENEVTKWESKYLEESTMRHIEVNAASVPKDAKIAALEQTSQQSEKMIQEARNERLKQMDELHGAHKRVAQLESKIRDMESKLAEKEAMIKVLQQHSRDKDVVLQKSLLAHRTVPARHIRSASSMGLTTFSLSTAKNSSSSVAEVREDNIRKENPESFGTGNGISSKTLNNSSNSNGPNSFAKESNGNPGAIKSSLTNSSTSTNSSSSTNSNNSSTTTSNNASTNNSSTFTLNSGSTDNEKITNNPNQNNLYEQLKELDKRLSNKDSIIRALRSESERYPNHYWKV